MTKKSLFEEYAEFLYSQQKSIRIWPGVLILIVSLVLYVVAFMNISGLFLIMGISMFFTSWMYFQKTGFVMMINRLTRKKGFEKEMFHKPSKKEVRFSKRRLFSFGMAVLLLLLLLMPIVLSHPIIHGFTGFNQSYYPVFSDEVIIANRSHFKYFCGYVEDEYDIDITMSVLNGSDIDLYIMREDQYQSVYENPNQPNISFSALSNHEKISSYKGKIEPLVGPGNAKIYLVLDNQDIPLISSDAVPTGPVEVRLELTIYDTLVFD